MSTVARPDDAYWPPTNPPEPTYLDDRLNHWADATPDEEAMTFLDRSWTWREWHERVHRAAGGLRELGVARGDVVGFVDKKHSARVEITLAAASIGAANAIIDWRLDADAIAQVLNECGARVLFVGTEFAATGAAIGDRVPRLMRVIEVTTDGVDCPYEAFLEASRFAIDGPDVLDSDVCMIRYTGTGADRPTGLRLTQREVIDSNAQQAGLEFLPVLADVHAGRHTVIAREGGR